ncbi:hypothetical protein GGR58DRAFT_468132 [Xylaria digitata]|nr:hypothetical protein GGR58DRAFT_468132 [Xylaria digitata]
MATLTINSISLFAYTCMRVWLTLLCFTTASRINVQINVIGVLLAVDFTAAIGLIWLIRYY